MRKLILFLCVSLPAFGTYNYTMQFDVRSTGSDSNPGGFDPGVASPGTDYSQQNSPQITYTDLVIGATTTQFTSVLNPVSSLLPGNTLTVTSGSGCNQYQFEILSNATITATVDKSLGTAASVCHAVLGGAKATLCGTVSSSQCTSGALSAVANALNTVWVKSGTYSIGSTTMYVANGNSGGITSVTVAGYYSTHGDITPACVAAATCTRPVITTATNSAVMLYTPGNYLANAYVFKNLVFSNTASSPYGMVGLTGANVLFYLCKFDTSGEGSANSGVFNTGNVTLYGTFWLCEFSNVSGGAGFVDAGTSGSPQFWFYSCYFHGGSAGISNNNVNNQQFWHVQGSVFSGNTRGIDGRVSPEADFGVASLTVLNSVFYNPTNEGINLGSYALQFFWAGNNIFYGGTYGIYVYGYIANGSSVPFGQQMAVSNAYGNQSTAAYLPLSFGAATSGVLGGFPAGAGDVTLTANPFINAASGNFALNSTAGGGAVLKAAGFPGVAGFGTGYLDIGALQSQAAAATPPTPHAYVQ